jgi:hypothetical protein
VQPEMRACLIDGCKRHGLGITGYSGRDASILEALNAALSAGESFPGGLFWFKRHQDELYPAVGAFMNAASAQGIDAHVVEAETFDEVFADILRFLPETEREISALAGATRPRLAKIISRPSVKNIPAIRTNADIGLHTLQRSALRWSRLTECHSCRSRPRAFQRDAEFVGQRPHLETERLRSRDFGKLTREAMLEIDETDPMVTSFCSALSLSSMLQPLGDALAQTAQASGYEVVRQ